METAFRATCVGWSDKSSLHSSPKVIDEPTYNVSNPYARYDTYRYKKVIHSLNDKMLFF